MKIIDDYFGDDGDDDEKGKDCKTSDIPLEVFESWNIMGMTLTMACDNYELDSLILGWDLLPVWLRWQLSLVSLSRWLPSLTSRFLFITIKTIIGIIAMK